MAPAAGPPGPAAVAGTPLDPHRDEARRLLQEELDSGTYQLQESLVSRVNPRAACSATLPCPSIDAA